MYKVGHHQSGVYKLFKGMSETVNLNRESASLMQACYIKLHKFIHFEEFPI